MPRALKQTTSSRDALASPGGSSEAPSSPPLPPAVTSPPPPPPPPVNSPPSSARRARTRSNSTTGGNGNSNGTVTAFQQLKDDDESDRRLPSSNFSSPLPPCPEEDPCAPPPPSCTPPKYHPSEDNENTEEDDEGERGADAEDTAEEHNEEEVFPTPPPPPSPPVNSPPPPPPPYSPPSARKTATLRDDTEPTGVFLGEEAIRESLKRAARLAQQQLENHQQEERQEQLHDQQQQQQDKVAHDPEEHRNRPHHNGHLQAFKRDDPDDGLAEEEDNGEYDGDRSRDQEQVQEHDGIDQDDGEDQNMQDPNDNDPPESPNASASYSIAAMRSAYSDREIMATEVVREPVPERPRWYLGDIDQYTIIDKVGSGTYGEVFKCQHKISKDIVALKKLRQDVEKNGFPVTSIREIKILKMLKHPNIVELKEIVSTNVPPKEGKKPPLYFAFEYMEHDLSGLLNHPRVKFSRTQIQCYMRQLLCGIAFMHRNKIIHRDIKASNLLLNNQGMLKIADFGLSRLWSEVNARAGRYTNKVVTLWYRSPELLMGSTCYDFSVDVWSVGCIFGELLLGKPILQGKTEIEQLQLIFGLCGLPTQENWPDYLKLPGARAFDLDEKYVCRLHDRFKNFPAVAVDLLEKLLTLDPKKRISAVEALDHDYFWRVPTAKPRDLPKFCVASTHEYQSKKRHREEMAAVAAAAGTDSSQAQAHPSRHVRARDRGYRDRNDGFRGGRGGPGGRHHGGSFPGRDAASGGGMYRGYRYRGGANEYYDRDRDRSRERDRDRRDREHDRNRTRERDGGHHARYRPNRHVEGTHRRHDASSGTGTSGGSDGGSRTMKHDE